MSRKKDARAARRSERTSAERAAEDRDGRVKAYADMNRAERRKYERAMRRGKAVTVGHVVLSKGRQQ